MKLRLAAAVVAASALAAPASAQGASLKAGTSKPCYGTADAVPLRGAGYTPASPVRLTRDGLAFPKPITPDAAGGFSVLARVGVIPEGKRSTLFSATDTTDAAITANSAPVRVSATTVRVRPANAAPTTPRRIRANGFTTGRTLYMHVVRGGRSRNVRVGRLKGACKAVSARRRFFRANFRTGTYRLQFDTFRRYRSSRIQKVVFPLRVVRTFRPASISSFELGMARAQVLGEGSAHRAALLGRGHPVASE